MAIPRSPFIAAFLRYAGRLRFKQLFFITGGLFLLDMVMPDLVPFADEIILGLLTLLFGAWKKNGRDPAQDAGDDRVIDAEVIKTEPPAGRSRR